MNTTPNNQNIVKTSITTKVFNNNKIPQEEIHKKINDHLSLQKMPNQPNNINIYEKKIQGSVKSKIITNTASIYNNNRKIIKQNKKIENNKISNINNNDIVKESIKKEDITLANLTEKISKIEEKEKNENNNLECKNDSKKSKIYSVENISKKIFLNNVKYDFDNSRNEEDENELTENRFELLEKTPEKEVHSDQTYIGEKKHKLPKMNINLLSQHNEINNSNNNELKQSIQELNSVSFGAPNENNINYVSLSPNFSFGFKKPSDNDLKKSDNIKNNSNNQNIVSFRYQNDKNQNQNDVNENNQISNEQDSKNMFIKRKKEGKMALLDNNIKFGINEEKEIQKEENVLQNEIQNSNAINNKDYVKIEPKDAIKSENLNIKSINSNNRNKEKNETIDKEGGQKEKIKEVNKEGEKIKSLFDADWKGIDKSKIFSLSINKSDNEKETKMKDTKQFEGIFYEEFNKDNKELNLNLPLNNESNKLENPFMSKIDSSNNKFSSLFSNINNIGESLFGNKDLFGNEGMKIGSFGLFNTNNSSEIKKEQNKEQTIKDDKINKISKNPEIRIKEKNEKLNNSNDIIYSQNPFISNTNENKKEKNMIKKNESSIIFTINNEKNKLDNLKNNNEYDKQNEINPFSNKNNSIKQENEVKIINNCIDKTEENINKNERQFLSIKDEINKRNNNKSKDTKIIDKQNPFTFIFDGTQKNDDKNEVKGITKIGLFNNESLCNKSISDNINNNTSNGSNLFKNLNNKEEISDKINLIDKEDKKETIKVENINTNKNKPSFSNFGKNIFDKEKKEEKIIENESKTSPSLFNNLDNKYNSSSLFSNQFIINESNKLQQLKVSYD